MNQSQQNYLIASSILLGAFSLVSVYSVWQFTPLSHIRITKNLQASDTRTKMFHNRSFGLQFSYPTLRSDNQPITVAHRSYSREDFQTIELLGVQRYFFIDRLDNITVSEHYNVVSVREKDRQMKLYREVIEVTPLTEMTIGKINAYQFQIVGSKEFEEDVKHTVILFQHKKRVYRIIYTSDDLDIADQVLGTVKLL